jgi:hypothetical protein
MNAANDFFAVRGHGARLRMHGRCPAHPHANPPPSRGREKKFCTLPPCGGGSGWGVL